ncbi:MAG: GDSL-type esterase/lipase family protein [Planctomycetota bacterium]|nr:GDSL-type esterase/lipase family protein [Planctomycetota bacterium]
MEPKRPRPRPIVKLLAVSVATLAALGLAEVTVRLLASQPRVLGAIGFETEDGAPIANYAEGVQQGLIVAVPDPKPRPRFMFRPGLRFFITYRDQDVLQRDWLDERGRVSNRINSAGVRDREELTQPKPAGQRRIVCVGDSFTFGWGIPEEQNWVRMLEDSLRADGADVRTVNCGAAGTVCVDEYVDGLQRRFARFEPDAVVLTICLNDLMGSDGLLVLGPPVDTGSALLDLLLGAAGRGPLALDPGYDWVQDLMDMPEIYPDGTPNPRFGADKPFASMWSQGTPQKSLREAKSWCDSRSIPFMVVLWPFLQGLGEGRHYPFQKLHDLVASDMDQAGIPLLDVTAALQGTDHEELWVTPADTHPNPTAQRLAAPAITRFVRQQTGW